MISMVEMQRAAKLQSAVARKKLLEGSFLEIPVVEAESCEAADSCRQKEASRGQEGIHKAAQEQNTFFYHFQFKKNNLSKGVNQLYNLERKR